MNRGEDTWWCNEEVKDGTAKKKKAFKDLHKDRREANKLLHKKIRNRTKKVMASAMRKEAEKETKDLQAEPCFQVGKVDEERWERCHRQ